jgi:Cdc6-like AAA superfamily ATPase
MSRLIPEQIEFKPYKKEETQGIIAERIKLTFFPEVWDAETTQKVVDKTHDQNDIRTGLYLLKEAGLATEERSGKTVSLADVKIAIDKMQDFKTKKIDELGDEVQDILSIIKENSPARIGDIFEIFTKAGGSMSYKTFQRRVQKLEENNFIKTKKQMGGSEGTTTMIYYDTATTKLDDFTSANNI